jgi:hypothetical protein
MTLDNAEYYGKLIHLQDCLSLYSLQIPVGKRVETKGWDDDSPTSSELEICNPEGNDDFG